MHKIAKVFHLLLPISVIAISGWVHHLAGFTFPVPWDDEAVFIYPAAAVADSWQIQTDSLNRDRAVFWHPPGYPVAMGLFMKLAQTSLASARLFSWLLMAIAYLACMRMARSLASRTFAEIMLSLFYLGGPATIAGNIARPEALVLALSLAGFWMLLDNRPWTAASMLVLACLVHPAAWFLAAAAAVGYLREYGCHWPRLEKSDIPWVLLAFGCTAALASYLALNWSWVWNDLQVGIHFLPMTWAQRLRPLISLWRGIPALLVLSLPLVTFRMRRPLFFLSLLAVALWFIPVYRPEMWYAVYTAFSYAIAAWILVEIAARNLPVDMRRIGAPSVFAALVLGGFIIGHVPDPRHYPLYFWWWHMTIRDRPNYIDDSDYAAIATALDARSASPGDARVQFYPGGDGTLFLRRLPAPWIPYYPSFTDIPPTAIVIHQTRLAYPGHAPQISNTMQSAGINPENPIHARDETEKWFIYFPEATPASAAIEDFSTVP
jgi:hypothetical protein